MTARAAGAKSTAMGALGARYRAVVASIYLYNEHRGYTALDRVLEAARVACADDAAFIAAVAKHRADEHKHYAMFRRWFELRGEMPLGVDSGYGHIDRFIGFIFGCRIDELDVDRVLSDPGAFEQLCRVIVLTEQRGLRQVEVLLRHRLIRADPALLRIFEVIHRDEPDHFLPYAQWLARQGCSASTWRERLADATIHKLLLLVKLPALFLNPRARRLTMWPDTRPV